MMTKNQAEAIAEAVAALRPGWDTAGIVKALGACKDHPDAFAVALAAIAAAADDTNRTPAVIPLAGRHWQTRPADTVPVVGAGREARCETHHYELARACRCCRAERLAPPPNPFDPTPATESRTA